LKHIIKIGTRESQLAVWQATHVQKLLEKNNIQSELIYIKSEGDIDTVTPLYEIGVQGIFTKTLDAALINERIDIAVHSMKDVPTQLAKGIQQAAVLKRGNYKDILVLHPDIDKRNNLFSLKSISTTTIGRGKIVKENVWNLPLREDVENPNKSEKIVVATSSIRRIAQWLNHYPDSKIENLRGNINTRLRKLKESNWHGAIFAAAGLERINLRPQNAIDLDWMLPAPAQGAIMIACRENDNDTKEKCLLLNDETTALCTKIERDFLRTLLGGCSTPVSALAEIKKGRIIFKGNIFSLDGKEKVDTSYSAFVKDSVDLGANAAKELLKHGGEKIMLQIRNAST
jgi:hydroxymethylbilane synthase